jgi:hypothetical protein
MRRGTDPLFHVNKTKRIRVLELRGLINEIDRINK